MSDLTEQPSVEQAWLVLAAGDDREHAGNDGYDDDPTSHYVWDSTVANHALLAPGQPIVIWDKRAVIGASVIERVEQKSGRKTVYRCVACGRSSIKRRKHEKPTYRCFSCGAVFEHAAPEIKDVTMYRSLHGVGYVDLAGVLGAATLRSLCLNPRSQHSLRRLDWDKFVHTIEASKYAGQLSATVARKKQLAGGHTKATVRVRLGQGAFRRALLERHGDVCAIGGPTPRSTLEAGHLYSYAAIGEHHGDGGLLLRRDIHRLFDLGLISVNPSTCTIWTSPELDTYPEYARLGGEKLKIVPTRRQLGWLRAHFEQHTAPA